MQDREAGARYWRAFGEWVRAQRKAQQPDAWTQERLANELVRVGARASRNWINQIEKGDKPSDDLRRAIERLFGQFPEPDAEAIYSDNAVAQAIDRQTKAIREAIHDQTIALTALVAALLGNGTRNAKVSAEVQALADRLLSQRPGPDPVANRTP